MFTTLSADLRPEVEIVMVMNPDTAISEVNPLKLFPCINRQDNGSEKENQPS